jgi:hypothetical protein
MRKLSIIIVFMLTFAPSAFSESPQKLGIGLVLGAPTGFSLKYWESSRIAYQGSIGGMFGRGLMLGADYLVHERIFRNSSAPFYYGAGLFLGDPGLGAPSYSHGTLALGVRAAFGVDYLVRDYPFDIAVELGPALLLTPVTGMGIQLSVAFRFYP